MIFLGIHFATQTGQTSILNIFCIWTQNLLHESLCLVLDSGAKRCLDLQKTRMHSSKMRTARWLIVSPYLIVSHACPPPRQQPRTPLWSNHTCFTPWEQPHTPPPGAMTHALPRSNHAPPGATTHAPPPGSNHAHLPPGATTHAPPPVWTDRHL